jgi:hypothetical protein
VRDVPWGDPPPFDFPVAATRIKWRSPEWKFHTNIGHAKNAVGQSWYNGARGGQIWVLQDGEWSLKWDIKEGTKKENLPWNKN